MRHTWVGLTATVTAVAFATASPLAQQLDAVAVRTYQHDKARLMKTADLMPAEHYGFRLDANSKPFAANLVAVASLASRVCGEWVGRVATAAAGDAETRVTMKADVIRALGEGFAACDSFFGQAAGARPAAPAALDSLLEHFTSMADYLARHLRAKGIEPPK